MRQETRRSQRSPTHAHHKSRVRKKGLPKVSPCDCHKRATKPDHCFSVTGKRYSPPKSRTSRRILAHA
ncbi:hypothetical protein C1X35_00720 [Pseudomonas sp. FW306-1C-G01A]|nr:hypothetical protein [Pseudomonas mandelii]PMV83661.1 hypothetical protein C1X56_26300 [Pseudomonas sp. GW101-1A09]PMV93805.1 hypothetical protein C1X51_14590 [Pseudomonas sp. FW306-2-2C-B10A]PMV97759.1 hypothetical protein C1X55_16530 [Pseudomonas sp. GW460-C8]PMW01836.1 hypothetical protein C1X50_26030 [Pseudomonas sp. MPR-TSA4]PMW21470.1 hypothetical protein C1X53_15805 [Pseudomonas sp. GW456-E6]PMW22996.1 hypothetical protein C1X52_00340 [Pseudomonas sp. FW306-2-1A-C05A]PMW24615.1 hyp